MKSINQRIASLSPEKRAILEQRLKEKKVAQTQQQQTIPKQSRSAPLPLSFSQQRMWLLDQLEPGNPAYNRPTNLSLTGKLDIPMLEKSLNAIIHRHEILRTSFSVVDGEPVQMIAPKVTITLQIIDLTSLSEGEQDAEIKKSTQQEAQQRFNLTQSPLFRCKLLKLSLQNDLLLLTFHHIIFDGWSAEVLKQDLAKFYQYFSTENQSKIIDLPIQYTDFSQWQRQQMQGKNLQHQLAYWKKQLAGELPILELPIDRLRAPIQNFRGKKKSIQLSPQLTQSLKALSCQEGVTLFMTLLAAFKILLYRYTHQEDIIIGSPIAGRDRLETEQLIGVFINTLVFRTQLQTNLTFKELLLRVKNIALEAYAHKELPFEKLVEELKPDRNLSHSPLFQILFQFRNIPQKHIELKDIKFEDYKLDREISAFDLSLDILEHNEGLLCQFEYNTDLLNPDRITRMMEHFQVLLEGIVANPTQGISTLPLLTESERHQLLVEWNQTQTDYLNNLCIHQLFEEQVERTPDAIALVFNDQKITYIQLNQKANQLAYHFRKLGVKSEVLVGICVERSIDMVIGILAILKAGGAYLPLDPTDPTERLAFMLEEAQVSVLLTQEKWKDKLPETTAEIIELDKFETLNYDVTNLPNLATANHLAYVMYTSGSTGQPKGVSIIHRGVVRLVQNNTYARLTSEEVFLQLAPISFDASTFEIWGSLLNGAKLVILSPGIPSLGQIGQAIRDQGVTTLWLTAGLFHLMVDERLEDLKPLRQLLAGGDVLSVAHVEKFLQTIPSCQLINGYGPTENTTFTCCYPITDATQLGNSVPIGRAIANTQVYVLDGQMQPVPIGIPGELYIGGDGLARGYLNRPELTAEKFISNPFGAGRLYKTGDQARYLPDGNIEFIGRIDHQVKIRGFRVEPGEIEAVLLQHPNVTECLVLAREQSLGDKRLVAYIVPKQEQVPTLEELRQFFKQKLPDYMIPAIFVPLEAMPLTPNGKVDRAALPVPGSVQQTLEQTFVPPKTPVEKKLAAIWAKVLWLEQEVGIHDNFFDLGGHSLLSVSLVAEIEKTFNTKLPLADFFQLSTIAELAKILERENSEPESPTVDKQPLFDFNPDSTQPQLDPEIYHQQLAYIAGWKGQRVNSNSLIVGLNTTGTQPPLFWCLQGFLELSQLAKYLGEDQPTYGMRSGHLAMEYNSVNLKALATYYTSEILTVQPEEPYLIGGNCLGGLIAFEIAQQLQQKGKIVTLLCLYERFIPQSYSGRIALLFGRESPVNPYKSFQFPEQGWRKLYPHGFSVDLFPWGHGQFPKEPCIQLIAEKLTARVKEALSEPTSSLLMTNDESDQLLPPQAYQVQLTAQKSLTASVDQTILILVTVKNISTVTWASTAESGIALGNHWLNEDGEVIQWADGRVDFTNAVPPGGEIELSLTITTPLESGHYLLELDLVEEGITWFKNQGSQTTNVEVDITAKKQITQSSLQDFQAFITLGNTQFEKGDTERAIINYKKAIALNPQQPLDVYQNLGDAQYQHKQFEAAILTYQEALQRQPDDPSLYYRLGRAQHKNQDIEQAIASYQKAIELNPDHFEYYQYLGDAFKQKKYFEEAILAYQKVLKIQPDHPQIYIQLAQVQCQFGNKEAGIANYQKAIDLAPDNMGFYKALGDILTQQEKFKEALETYQKALQFQPNSPAIYCSLGNSQLKQGKIEAAIAHYQKAIEFDPAYFQAYTALGNICAQQEQWEEAIFNYQKAIELQPERLGIHIQLAKTQRKQGKIEEAIANYQKVIELDPDSGEAYFQIGNTWSQQNLLEAAISNYQKAIELQPERPGIYLQLANTQRKQGKIEEAIANYQKVIELNPEFVGAYVQLGNILSEQGQLEEAISNYQEVLKLQPKHPVASRQLKQLQAKVSRTVISILGMHRSGTSCLAGSLQAAGLFCGEVLEWNTDNLKGHRENQDIMNLNNDILKANEGSWDQPPAEIQWLPQHSEQRDAIIAEFNRQARVWMFKDPRTVLMLPFWQEGIADLQLVGTFRHPLKVAMSVYQRPLLPISLYQGIKLWVDYNRRLLDAFRQAPFPLLCFDLSPKEYLTQLEQLIRQFKTQLGERISLSIKAGREFYETTLVHQPNFIAWQGTETQATTNDYAQLIVTAQELYQELRQAAGCPESTTLSPESGELAYFLPVEETLEACQDILKLQPDNPYVYFIQGNIQRQQEDMAGAIVSYRKALELVPDHFGFYQHLGTVLTQNGDFEGAKTLYLEALKYQPDNPQIYSFLANIQQKQGDVESAIASYRKAIEIYPKHFGSYLNLGRVLTQQKQFDAAWTVYEQALELQPEHPGLYCHLANFQRKQGNLEAAMNHYQKAIELNPQYGEAYLQLGNTLQKQGNLEAAISNYQTTLELQPERSGAYIQLANAQRKQGNLEAAISNYRKEIEINSRAGEAYLQLGNIFNQQGQLEEAISNYQTVLKLQPKRSGVYIQLANIQQKQGNLEAAITNYQKAIELNPQKPAMVYKSLGDAFSQVPNIDEAIKAYQQSLKLQPKNPELRRSLKQLKARTATNR